MEKNQKKEIHDKLEKLLFEDYPDFRNTSALIEISGQLPSEELIQRVFQHYLSHANQYDLSHVGFDGMEYTKTLLSKLGRKPLLDEQQIQILQGKYRKSVQIGDIKTIEKLIKMTGVEPVLSDEDIQEGYKNCLNEALTGNKYYADKGVSDCRRLESISGIPIKESTIQEITRRFFERSLIPGSYGKFRHILESIGFFQNFPEDKVHEEYSKLFRAGFIDWIIDLKRFTGISPRIKEQEVQEGYNLLFKEDIGQNGIHINPRSLIHQLMLFTNIRPSESIVQSYYVEKIRKDKIDDISKIAEITGIKPSLPQEEVINAYEATLRDNDFDKLKRIRDVTGICYPQENIQRKYQEYIDFVLL